MKKRRKYSEDTRDVHHRNPKILLKIIDRKLKKKPDDIRLLWEKSIWIQGTPVQNNFS
jgi:hypothetical protein